MGQMDNFLETLKQYKPYVPARPATNAEQDAESYGVDEFSAKTQDSQSYSTLASVSEDGSADIAIITALSSPELDRTRQAFAEEWTELGREAAIFFKARTEFDGEPLKIVAAAQDDIGMIPAAILATKTILAWRPKVLLMTGVCAGAGSVNLGDVVVARQLIDYESGKINQGRLLPAYRPVLLNDQLSMCVNQFNSTVPEMSSIRDSWPLAGTGKPDSALRAHLGVMASGAAVVADAKVVDRIREHQRSLLALDMESYGIARAAASSIVPPLTFIVKGVQDFADQAKDDRYREYAAFVSAEYSYRFLRRYWATLSKTWAQMFRQVNPAG